MDAKAEKIIIRLIDFRYVNKEPMNPYLNGVSNLLDFLK